MPEFKHLKNYIYMARRIEARQVIHRLKSQIYFTSRNRWPRLQWPVQALRDKRLAHLFVFSDDTQARLAQVCRDGEFEIANDLILETLRLRTTPRFYFARSDRSLYRQVAREDLPEQYQQTLIRANSFLDGWWPLSKNVDRDKHPIRLGTNWWNINPSGKIEYAVRLHSCRDLIHLARAYWYTGNDLFARQCFDLVQDWITRHPVGQLPAWKPMAASLRTLTWSWLVELLLDATVITDEEMVTWLKSLYQHGLFLEQHLEFDHANNHLLFNLVGLLVLALTFPELRSARRWQQLASRHLREQIPQLVYSDGVYSECSSYYHMIMTDLLLQAIILLRRNDLSLADEINTLVEKMADFCLHIRLPDGNIPMLSDSYLESDLCTLEDVLTTAGLVFDRHDFLANTSGPSERAFWLWGREAIDGYGKEQTTITLSSRVFPQGGYYISRSGSGDDSIYAIIDCGPFGLPRNPAHGHCDALSINLHALGHQMLTDPGVFEYESGQWRDFFRGTSAHNTVVVDGQEQSELWGRMRVGRMARATCHQWLSTPSFDFFDGAHDGYTRLSDPVIHRRQIFYLKRDYLIVCDHLIAQETHQVDTFYHLPPNTRVSANETGTSLIADFHGAYLALFPTDGEPATIIAGQIDPPQGWVSYANGAKLPATVIHWHKLCTGPTSSGVVLCPYREKSPVVRVDKISFTNSILGAIVRRIDGDDWVFSALVPQSFHLRQELSGQAKIFWLRRNARSTPRAFAGVDVTNIQSAGHLLLESSKSISWLDVRYDGDVIKLVHSQQQPFTLRLWAPDVTNVEANGSLVSFARHNDEISFLCE